MVIFDHLESTYELLMSCGSKIMASENDRARKDDAKADVRDVYHWNTYRRPKGEEVLRLKMGTYAITVMSQVGKYLPMRIEHERKD